MNLDNLIHTQTNCRLDALQSPLNATSLRESGQSLKNFLYPSMASPALCKPSLPICFEPQGVKPAPLAMLNCQLVQVLQMVLEQMFELIKSFLPAKKTTSISQDSDTIQKPNTSNTGPIGGGTSTGNSKLDDLFEEANGALNPMPLTQKGVASGVLDEPLRSYDMNTDSSDIVTDNQAQSQVPTYSTGSEALTAILGMLTRIYELLSGRTTASAQTGISNLPFLTTSEAASEIYEEKPKKSGSFFTTLFKSGKKLCKNIFKAAGDCVKGWLGSAVAALFA